MRSERAMQALREKIAKWDDFTAAVETALQQAAAAGFTKPYDIAVNIQVEMDLRDLCVIRKKTKRGF